MSKGETIKNYQEKQKYIQKASEVEKKYNLPQNMLVGLMATESNFNPKAVSPVGARGLMQFMPATAKEFGIDPFNTDQAIDAAGKYLANNYEKLGNWDDTLRSYNMGLGGVQQWKAGNRKLPKETAEYVGKVYKNMGVKYESSEYGSIISESSPTTPLIDFDIPTINRSFASVPDSPKEETKKEEKPSEALNQLKEQEFVKQYKSLLTQPQVAQQEQEVNQPIQIADLQGIFNQVSQFVDGDVAQQGGKKPIYVTDKNDPRYKAYNDSLNSFEKSESFKNDIIKYVGKNISKSQQEEMINLAMNYQREKYDYDKGWNRKIEPIDKTVIHLTKTFKNGAEGNIDLENYKKPQQPIILEETRPKVQGLNTNITPAGIQTQQELPQGEELQQRTYAQIPTSYNVSSQRYNMQGENPYYNFNAEDVNYETALRAKLSAENYNADIERRYGNEEALKNPKAVERLNQLRQEVKITPNYQNGGEIVKDNNGYWNPNNWGKTVEIDGGDITMKGVTQILEGYSPETGERKLMFPNFDYKFSGAKRVIETPLKDNEIEFLKNIKK